MYGLRPRLWQVANGGNASERAGPAWVEQDSWREAMLRGWGMMPCSAADAVTAIVLLHS